MSRSLVHRLARVLSGVVLVASGSYVFIYLVRWEWNRALIAGLFFLAAELVLIADVLLVPCRGPGSADRDGSSPGADHRTGSPAAGQPPATPGPFAWLAPDRDRVDVFLPILIGAGVVLSAVAYLVEQVSRVTAVPVAEHELARGLSTMALPIEGLSPLAACPKRPPAPWRSRPRGMGVAVDHRRWAGRRPRGGNPGRCPAAPEHARAPGPGSRGGGGPGRDAPGPGGAGSRRGARPVVGLPCPDPPGCPAGLPGAHRRLRPAAPATDHESRAGGVGHQAVRRLRAGRGHRAGPRRRPGGLARRLIGRWRLSPRPSADGAR